MPLMLEALQFTLIPENVRRDTIYQLEPQDSRSATFRAPSDRKEKAIRRADLPVLQPPTQG
jgi:hypothetical protein